MSRNISLFYKKNTASKIVTDSSVASPKITKMFPLILLLKFPITLLKIQNTLLHIQDNNLQNKSEYLNRYQQEKKFYLLSITLNCNSQSIHIVYRRHIETRMFSRNVGNQICIGTASDLTKTNTSFTLLRWAKTSPAFTFSNRSRPELALQSLVGYSVCTTESFHGEKTTGAWSWPLISI
jgi:hypothetical protein